MNRCIGRLLSRCIRKPLSLAVIAAVLSSVASAALPLHKEASSPFDLKVSGMLQGVPKGEVRYVQWKELKALPHHTISVTGEFVPGEQTITYVWLSDLWKALPMLAGADTVLATCSDGYASVYRDRFIQEYKPFVVLEINGKGPDTWPPEGLKFNPGPYVISISEAIVPKVHGLLDAGHKKPWGVNAIEVVRYDQRFSVFLEGRWSALSPRAVEGRELWVNSCFSCHQAPGATLGGWKSGRPFEVVSAHAGYNRDYFMRFVRDPQKTMPGAKMEAHPHYTDTQLEALMAFITAESSTETAAKP